MDDRFIQPSQQFESLVDSLNRDLNTLKSLNDMKLSGLTIFDPVLLFHNILYKNILALGLYYTEFVMENFEFGSDFASEMLEKKLMVANINVQKLLCLSDYDKYSHEVKANVDKGEFELHSGVLKLLSDFYNSFRFNDKTGCLAVLCGLCKYNINTIDELNTLVDSKSFNYLDILKVEFTAMMAVDFNNYDLSLEDDCVSNWVTECKNIYSEINVLQFDDDALERALDLYVSLNNKMMDKIQSFNSKLKSAFNDYLQMQSNLTNIKQNMHVTVDMSSVDLKVDTNVQSLNNNETEIDNNTEESYETNFESEDTEESNNAGFDEYENYERDYNGNQLVPDDVSSNEAFNILPTGASSDDEDDED